MWLIPAALVAVAAHLIATRHLPPGRRPLGWQGRAGAMAGRTLSVVTWNLGFGGLGAGASMVTDGGDRLRPLDRETIGRAAVDIAETLAGLDVDVVLLQEDAKAGFLNRGVDLKGRVRAALPAHTHVFWPDFRTWGMPLPLGFRHGLSLLSRASPAGKAEVFWPPQDEVRFFGVYKKYYGGLLARLPMTGGGTWVVMSIHLSAFDERAEARHRQVAALIELAQAEYRRGRHVVIGGDWNMVLASMPRATAGEHAAESASPFPAGLLPEGWKIVADKAAPTSRAMSAGYVPGQTPTRIIDGFLISPNVELQEVATVDQGFARSDHNPVRARFLAGTQAD